MGSTARFDAEGGGFEPPVPCGTLVFKTSAFGHSATPPDGCGILSNGFRSFHADSYQPLPGFR